MTQPTCTTCAHNHECAAYRAATVVDFIECNLIENIRADVAIDNIQWLVSIIHVYEKAKAIAEDNE